MKLRILVYVIRFLFVELPETFIGAPLVSIAALWLD
jgi:hypothetical protein